MFERSTTIRLFLLAAGTLCAAACGDNGSPAGPLPTPTAVAPTPTPQPTSTLAPPTATSTPAATPTPFDAGGFRFDEPRQGQLSLRGPVTVRLLVPEAVDLDSLVVRLDGEEFGLTPTESGLAGTADGLATGIHRLEAEGNVDGVRLATSVSFELVELDRPDLCEPLNDVECMLPYPSSRFLVPSDTPTGWRVAFPEGGMPAQNGQPLSPEPYGVLDGFSPTTQILMHFPGGVDLGRSGASRLLPQIRTYGLRSLDPDSPSVLIDADSGERILHFLENDARAAGDPQRQALFLRPARSLRPGHRYIVAMRNLLHPDGSPVRAEPVFAALRDGRPTTIPAVEARRAHFEDLFARLERHGIRRDDLVLAFDFVVQSDEGLTGQMLAMRDQAFAWLEEQVAADRQTFVVENVEERDCAAPDAFVWRIVEGTYEVPLFLTSDPETDPAFPGVLQVDAGGRPVAEGVTNPPFTVMIPCSVLDDGGSPKPPLLFGHGLFGSGRSTLRGLAEFSEFAVFDRIVGATDFRGLSAPDIAGTLNSFIVGTIISQLDNFAALPDRLRQGMLNTLVLGRMLRLGLFNRDPAFRTPAGMGVFSGPDQEMVYFGASLGGIMGLFYSAVSPDIEKANVDVPAINFAFLLQRATPFIPLEPALRLTGITDPMTTALGISILHELWVRAEPAGYATHITRDPLPGTNPKHILLTVAYLDQQVSNQGSEIAARTLGLPNLEGSVWRGLPQIPDLPGPLPSAMVVYDTGSFDLDNPEHQPFIPPLANLQAEPNDCDPHGLRGFIPASIEQLAEFFRPGGMVVNFCHDLCDAGDPSEIPFGADEPCDPLAP